MKIWLVTKCYSDWDENEIRIIRAFEYELDAERYIQKANNVFRKLRKFYGEQDRKYDNSFNLDNKVPYNIKVWSCKYSLLRGREFYIQQIELV